jgi:hypothetical protein
MKLHGSISDNLASALRSVRRLRGHAVHADTIGHWTDLLHHARRQLSREPDADLQAVMLDLKQELSDRGP